jgi:hypothetical protein
MVASRGTSYFLESSSTGSKSHTGQWLAADITRLTQIYPNLEVAGVVTDNASPNRSAWKILMAQNTKGFYYGNIDFFPFSYIFASHIFFCRLCFSRFELVG